jgi:hypothetical protein
MNTESEIEQVSSGQSGAEEEDFREAEVAR